MLPRETNILFIFRTDLYCLLNQKNRLHLFSLICVPHCFYTVKYQHICYIKEHIYFMTFRQATHSEVNMFLCKWRKRNTKPEKRGWVRTCRNEEEKECADLANRSWRKGVYDWVDAADCLLVDLGSYLPLKWFLSADLALPCSPLLKQSSLDESWAQKITKRSVFMTNRKWRQWGKKWPVILLSLKDMLMKLCFFGRCCHLFF